MTARRITPYNVRVPVNVYRIASQIAKYERRSVASMIHELLLSGILAWWQRHPDAKLPHSSTLPFPPPSH